MTIERIFNNFMKLIRYKYVSRWYKEYNTYKNRLFYWTYFSLTVEKKVSNNINIFRKNYPSSLPLAKMKTLWHYSWDRICSQIFLTVLEANSEEKFVIFSHISMLKLKIRIYRVKFLIGVFFIAKIIRQSYIYNEYQ